MAERTRRFRVGRWYIDDFGRGITHARHPRIVRRTSPDREGEPTAGREPAGQVGKRAKRIIEEHHAEARDQSLVRNSGRRPRRYVRSFESDGTVIGRCAMPSQLDQRWRDVEAVNDASRWRPA